MIGAGITGFLVLAAAWYLASPLFIDRTVDEALPFEIPSESELSQMPPSERTQTADEVQEAAAAMPDKAMEESMPAAAEPNLLRSGSFVDADSFHQGSGTAAIFQLEDGKRVLRLEDFSVTNGPDLHVLLATGASPSDRDSLGDTFDLGALKGNVGNQNYDIPEGLDLERYNSLVIYCVPFHVVFSTATLSN
jgi:hypothetical protein